MSNTRKARAGTLAAEIRRQKRCADAEGLASKLCEMTGRGSSGHLKKRLLNAESDLSVLPERPSALLDVRIVPFLRSYDDVRAQVYAVVKNVEFSPSRKLMRSFRRRELPPAGKLSCRAGGGGLGRALDRCCAAWQI